MLGFCLLYPTRSDFFRPDRVCPAFSGVGKLTNDIKVPTLSYFFRLDKTEILESQSYLRGTIIAFP